MKRTNKRILNYLPVFGFALSFLLSSFDFIRLVWQGIPDNHTLVANLLLLVNTLIILFIVYGLLKFEKRVFWLALVASFLSFVSLYFNPQLKEFISLISGLILLMNKKVLHLK